MSFLGLGGVCLSQDDYVDEKLAVAPPFAAEQIDIGAAHAVVFLENYLACRGSPSAALQVYFS